VSAICPDAGLAVGPARFLSTMPPKKETPIAKAALLTALGNEIKVMSDFQCCVASMKDRPHIVASVKHHLQSTGNFIEADALPTPKKKQKRDGEPGQPRKLSGATQNKLLWFLLFWVLITLVFLLFFIPFC
jgi:hypothetical protein